jgi:hypothetical protein
LGELESTYSSNPYLIDDEFNIYFNSNEEAIFVNVTNAKNAILSIFNMNGQLIEHIDWRPDNKRISTSFLIPGIYILHFNSEEKTKRIRFCIY